MAERDQRDRLYRDPASSGTDFVFDERVAAVFPDMINRSVPGYAAIIGMIEVLAQRYAQPASRLYDLGSSLGAATQALRNGCPFGDCTVVGVDNAPPMVERARQLVPPEGIPIDWVCADVCDVTVDDASIVTMNFTLQFLPPVERLAILSAVHTGLRDSGILILSEKIAGGDVVADQMLIDLHHAFKRANGYSELEISRKRSALENVLIPETLATHRDRLRQAGFSRVDVWFQCFNFVSMVAVR